MKGQLTLVERYQIQALRESQWTFRRIAKHLGRDASVLCREYNRNRIGGRYYLAEHAESLARGRRTRARPETRVVVGAIENEVRRGMKSHWSPKQIEGRLKLEGSKKTVSYSTIYRFVYRDARNGGTLYTQLRTQRPSRRKRRCSEVKKSLNYTEKIRNRCTIDDRPTCANERNRIGDFERDLMQGKNLTHLLTIVCRKSRKTFLSKIKDRHAKTVLKATCTRLKRELIRSMTNDNGVEFGEYERTIKALKAPIYYCHPHASWERGSVENTNGLIRQYLPRSIDFKKLTNGALRRIENRLNNRPRKCLGYRTPNEVYNL